MFKLAVITVSDRGARGERSDESGRAVAELVVAQGWEVTDTRMVSDDIEVIVKALIELCDQKMDLIFTTGGTGFALRDNTPEATLAVVERQAPGLAEAMRAETSKKSPRAFLSRAVAGIRKQTLIINLPGSPKAVRECLEAILPILPHGLEILAGRADECARK
jgi:molybdenum cofactor synthesis domain-containing protein